MRIERLVLVVVLLCLMVAVSNQNETAAQGGDREATRPYVQVTIGGRSDNYVYYTPDNPNYMRIVDILNKALPIYTTMTGRSWDHQIFVVFMGGNGTNLSVLGRMLDNSSAYVTRREPAERFAEAESCHIRVYPGWVTSSALESEVAYQFFHCIQMSLGAVGILDFGTRENAWWLMGTAEWAASRVYPEQYPKLIHSVFDPRQDITKARLDAYYFWEFASSARGMGNDQNVITQMGVLRTSGLFPLNFGFDSRELFHNWAQVLLNKQLPNPPIIDLTTSDLPAGEGGNYATPLPKFAVDYKNLVGFEIKPGHIGYVQVKGLAGSYAVSVRTANGIQRLADIRAAARARQLNARRRQPRLVFGQLEIAAAGQVAEEIALPPGALGIECRGLLAHHGDDPRRDVGKGGGTRQQASDVALQLGVEHGEL